MTVGGRVYPVQNHFLSYPANNFITKAAQLACDIHTKKPPGDILVFLTGKEEIEAFMGLFTDICTKDRYKLLPLHAQLSMGQQISVMNKVSSDIRKIIVATNIAESSVTIDGVVYVINSCFTKVKYYDYRRNIDILTTIPCSKSSALQRAGRAGRTRPGECYHLCTKEQFELMAEQSPPEIVRVNLMPAILQMKALGIANVWSFDYFTKPSEDSFIRALEALRALKLIDDNTNLTTLGKQVQDYPVDIRLAVALVSSTEMLTLVSATACEPIFQPLRNPQLIVKTKKLIGAREGDHLTSMNAIRYYLKQQGSSKKKQFCGEYRLVEKNIEKALELRALLEKILEKQGFDPKKSDPDTEGILRCLCTGFFIQAAQRKPDGSYVTISSRETIFLHPSSILTAVHPAWITYHDLTLSGQSGKAWARIASEVNVDWLTELVPEYYQDKKAEIAQSKHQAEVESAGLGKRVAGEDGGRIPVGVEAAKVQIVQMGSAMGVPKPRISMIKLAIEGVTTVDQAAKQGSVDLPKKKHKAVVDLDD